MISVSGVSMRFGSKVLFDDVTTTFSVGRRYGRVVVLTIRAGDMSRAGFAFFKTPNNVWLVDGVPSEFIDFHV